MDQQKEEWIRVSLAYFDSAMGVVNTHKIYNDWGTITDTCSQIVDTASEVLDSNNLNPTTEQKVRRALYFALYNLALSSYLDDDYAMAIKYLEPIDLNAFPLSAPLMGRCKQVYISNITNDPKQAWNAMLEYYHIFIQHEDEVFAENPTGIDQLLIGRAYFNLSLTYKDGLGVSRSLETAKGYLQKGISRLDENDVLKPLQEELSHYRMGLFGGLKYV